MHNRRVSWTSLQAFKSWVIGKLRKNEIIFNSFYKPNQKAMDAMGKEIWNNCFLLSQDLLENVEDMGYVCSKVLNKTTI